MTKQEAIKLLVLIESIYSSCFAKNETVLYWFEFCSEMDYEKVMRKLENHIRRSPYPPTIADIAVFNAIKNVFPEGLEPWMKNRGGMEQEGSNEFRRPIPAWMREYILK